jgi:DNA-binding NarL/FixJ family response regulator
VWVVDDNAALRELLAQLLTSQPGIRCTRQFPSAEALLNTLAEERPPDMVLLDINLGGMSGLSAIQPIKKLAPSVKVVMMTMFSNSHYEAEAFRSGAHGFVLKSYELDELVVLLHEANRNPDNPRLFPSISLQKAKKREAELPPEMAGSASQPFSLVGAIRRWCQTPRRRTAA